MRKTNKLEKRLLWSFIEDLIDEMTTVQVYANYVNCNLKKEVVKARNHLLKDVVEEMTLEIAMTALADSRINSLLNESKNQTDQKIE